MKFSVITATYNQRKYLMENRVWWERQTFKDFEWIIADDGSDDGTWEWAKEKGIKIVGNKKHKFDYDWSIYNKAAKVAKGEYLVWVMGDSYPKESFLQEMSDAIEWNKVVNGLRVNVDNRGRFVSDDWRAKGFDKTSPPIKVEWGHMTLNSMAMLTKLFKEIGGFSEEYKGYGRADIELVLQAHKAGAEMWVVPRALVNHRDHKYAKEAKHNIEVFDRRTKGLI